VRFTGRVVARRPRDALNWLESCIIEAPVLLDTNVILNGMARREPPELTALLDSLPEAFVSGPVIAELTWARGRLDPAHPNTANVLAVYDQVLRRIDPAKVLTPDAAEWAQAGEFAGATARALAGAGARMPADGRMELMNDAVTAVVALRAGATIVTADTDFDLLQQLSPTLKVVFY
jgi:predicted nucleic acid-binding protein